MSRNPLNLALRFALEMAALFACAYWGWTQHEGVWRGCSRIERDPYEDADKCTSFSRRVDSRLRGNDMWTCVVSSSD